MIKNKIIFEKNSLNVKNEEHLMLIELEGKKEKSNKKEKQKQLNLSLVIDISGSMDMPIHGGRNHYMINNIFNPQNSFEKNNFERSESKLSLVKKTAVNIVNSVKNGDYISVVAFADQVDTVQESIKITSKNGHEIISKINSLYTKGCTNLHGGWIEGCKQVSSNYNDKSLNRVLLLTDGETNVGITNPDEIVSDVLNVYNKSISVSTFGVGEQFNENLLQSMSNSGGGNFYFIENEKQFKDMFEEEFKGFSNIAAYDIKCKLLLDKDFTVLENHNKLTESKDFYLIPTISHKNKMSLLFTINTKKLKLKDNTLGKIELNYKNHKGEDINETFNIAINVVNKKEWDSLDSNKEIKVQEVLLTVAKNKELATQALERGDLNGAKDLLRGSMNVVGSCSFADDRLMAETDNLNDTLLSANTKSVESFKKDISYQSYKTRTNR